MDGTINKSTKTYFDAKRFRTILANSGKEMENGEARNLSRLFVMGTDGNLIRVADLNPDPEKQVEKYSVKAQADHGEWDAAAGDYRPSIRQQFGSCRVWLDRAKGLMAKMFFADNDDLADHAYAISESASYSTGIDWYPEGYEGAGNSVPGTVGILREISMVLTGNDPRATTIDKLQKGADGAGDENIEIKGAKMTEVKTDDNLTPDEAESLKEKLSGLIDDFTTTAPEAETEPTADEAEGGETETEAEDAEAEKNETKDKLRTPVIVIKDRGVQQEKIEMKKEEKWLTSKDGYRAYGETLKKAGHFGGYFDSLWRNELMQHQSVDGITGLPTPISEEIFELAAEKDDGILKYFKQSVARSKRVTLLSPAAGETGRAKGHKKGDLKQEQELSGTVRELLPIMIYKKLSLDALELIENPGLVRERAEELSQAIRVEIERSAFIGDGRSAATAPNADCRTFRDNRGFYSIRADAAVDTGFGNLVASRITHAAADNKTGYDLIVEAKGQIKSEGAQILVAKASFITSLLTERANGAPIVPLGGIENALRFERVFTPAWMDDDTDNEAYILVNGAYETAGLQSITQRADFDTNRNEDVLLAEIAKGGSLTKFKSAVAIAIATPANPGE